MPLLRNKRSAQEGGQAGGQQSGPRPEPGTRAERNWIKAERRRLRRELVEKGIRKRVDFEIVARDLGLTLDGGKRAGLLLSLRFRWTAFLTGMGIKSLIIAAGSLLTLTFLISALADKAGSFTINLTADMLKAGFVLSETMDFERQQSRLFSEEIKDVNNITLEDIGEDVDRIDGPHNANNYIAYTFYIKNIGESASSYKYYLNMDSQTMDVASAIWIMLFEDGRQVIYAKESADGDPEELFGFRGPPFGEYAYNYETGYYEEGGKYGVITTPYASESVVAQGLVGNVGVGEVHKYTVVIWVEGNDPECTNEIFGGYAKFSMNFEKGTDDGEGSIFEGVYRTEYEDYISGYSGTSGGGENENQASDENPEG